MANSKKQFYEVGSYSGSMREGSEICIQRQMNYRGQYADFKPFLNIPQKELEKRLKDSKAEEKKIYDGLQKAAKAWDEHGAQTLLLQKAIEYLKTPAVEHTANQWKQRKDGTWEISNLVYKMTYSSFDTDSSGGDGFRKSSGTPYRTGLMCCWYSCLTAWDAERTKRHSL